MKNKMYITGVSKAKEHNWWQKLFYPAYVPDYGFGFGPRADQFQEDGEEYAIFRLVARILRKMSPAALELYNQKKNSRKTVTLSEIEDTKDQDADNIIWEIGSEQCDLQLIADLGKSKLVLTGYDGLDFSFSSEDEAIVVKAREAAIALGDEVELIPWVEK